MGSAASTSRTSRVTWVPVAILTKRAAQRLRDRDEEGGVRLLVEHGIVRRVAAQGVQPDAERAQAVVQLDVEERAAVLGPLDGARGVGDEVGALLAALQVADVDAEALRAVLVRGVGEEAAVEGRLEGGQPEIVLAARQLVLVEDDDRLRLVERAAHPGAVLGAGGEAPLVLEPALARRDRLVVLLDPALQLGVQALHEAAVRRHEGLVIGVLGLDVGPDLGLLDVGIGRVAQPGVLVGPDDAEPLAALRRTPGERRLRQAHASPSLQVAARGPPVFY